MTAQFRREAKITIGGQSGQKVISYASAGLRMVFNVKKTAVSVPNTCLLSIYNLSESTRKRLQEKRDGVILEVGYEDSVTQIFKGGILTLNTNHDGADWVSNLMLRDGDARVERVSFTFGPGSTFREVALETAKATGLELGNLEKRLNESPPRNFTSYKKGTVVSGSARKELERLLETAGWIFSVQDGVIQVDEPGKSNPSSAKSIPIITPSSGLIGSPEVAENKIMTLRILLNPRIKPNDPIRVKTRQFDGDYTVQSIGHTGDTFGQNWYSDIVARVRNSTNTGGV